MKQENRHVAIVGTGGALLATRRQPVPAMSEANAPVTA